MVDQLAALLGLDPNLTELVEVVRLAEDALDHLATVFVHGDRDVSAIATTEDEAALRGDERLAWNLRHGRGFAASATTSTARRFTAAASATAGARRIGDEVGAEEVGDTSVVVEPELVFLGFLMDARAAPDHLVKLDRGVQVTEENHGVEPLDVHAGLQQVYGAGDEGSLAGAAHRLDHVRAVVGAAHALEGVVVLRLALVVAAPADVEVVHLHGHAVGMNLARAKDDDLLLWAAVLAEQFEKIGAHGRSPHVDEQLVIEILAGVVVLGQLFLSDGLAGLDVGGLGGEHFGLGEDFGVDGRLALDDFAGGEVAVFLRLNQRVFIDRLAKILVVVGGDLGVFVGLGLRLAKLARRGGQADVNRLGVALEHLGPLAPGGPMTLVDDDDAEGVFRVMLRQKAGKVIVFIVQA